MRRLSLRVVDALVLLWLVTTLTFALVHLAPGDPATLLIAPTATADEAAICAGLPTRSSSDTRSSVGTCGRHDSTGTPLPAAASAITLARSIGSMCTVAGGPDGEE